MLGRVVISLLLVVAAMIPLWAQAAPNVPVKMIVPANTGGMDIELIQTRREFLFQQMLERPDNLGVAFEYAALSTRVGDIEAAISTLERMLIFAPGLPRLQLELGLLYFRVSAYDTARSYFEAAISGPDVPDEVRRKVEQYLAGIDAAIKPDKFSGQVRAGIRYQTNANRAPTGSNITLNGNVFTLNPGSTGEADFNAYAAGTFHWSHELPSQGDTFEIDLVAYGSKQFKRTENDIALAELTAGPAFDLGRFNIDNATLGVYGIVSGVFLNGEFYSTAFGVGGRIVARPNVSDLVSLKTEYRHRTYYSSAGTPDAADRNGHEVRLQGVYRHIVNSRLAISAAAQFQRTWAQVEYLMYKEATFSIGPVFSFASPFGEDKLDWIASISAGSTFRYYDGPDPTINATSSQQDREDFVLASLTVPIKDGWSALIETEYRNSGSNYPTRVYDNLAASFSITKNW